MRRQDSWTWLLRKVLLPLGDAAFGQRMVKRLRFLEEAQWWEPERLFAERDRRVRSLIKLAYQEVPFYRGLMESAGVKPDAVQCAEDLRQLPIVTKQMLKAGYPHQTTRQTGLKTYEASSSGSTGTNFFVKEDSETAGMYRAAFLLALQWAGWRVGEPHLQTGMTLTRSLDRRLKDYMLRCHYVSAFDLRDSHLDSALGLLEKHRIKHLWGYPGSLFFLARRAREVGWNQPLRSIVTWGDNLYPRYRQTIEAAFQTRIFDTYGCGEGIQVAAQCGVLNTYHVHTPDVAVEYIDDDGCPLEPGQVGNLILTRLHPGPMPLIRYQVGDLGVKGEDRRCACGRGYEIMESVQGRDTDVVVTPSGNRLIVHFFTGIIEFFPEVECFQVVQERLESLVVRLVAGRNFSSDTPSRVAAALREKGADIEMTIEVVPEIPLAPSGKRRFVISKIAKPFVR